MAKSTWAQTNFNGGEWSPLAYGRFDIAKQKNGLATCLNYMPMQQGGLTRRPGTRYVADVKDSSYAPRLQRFEFSTTQAYVLEFGEQYVRFYVDDGRLLTGTVNPWTSGSMMYYEGDLVNDAGVAYVCILANDPSLHTTADTTYWLECDGSVYPHILHKEYFLGQRVSVLSNPYICIVASTTNAPGTPDWLRINGEATQWTSAVSYTQGTLVSRLGVNYYCLKDHLPVAHTPPDADYWLPLTDDILEVKTPYTRDELWQLGFTQSADTLYIVHPSHPPMKLQRAGATTWTIKEIAALDGPYLPVNVTTTTLTPTNTSGTVTVTASATTGINGGKGFLTSDVGRSLRIKCGGVWLWGTIATVVDSTEITWTITEPIGSQVPSTAHATASISAGSVFACPITDGGSGYGVVPPSVTISGGGGSGAIAYAVLSNGVVTSIVMSVTGTGYATPPTVTLAPPTATVPSTTTFWRLGEWNSVDGYPACTTFHQDRLWFAGATNNPSRVDASNSGDYENFAPTEQDGTVTDANALAFSLNSSTINPVLWMVSDEWGLLIGTAGGEWVIAPSSTQQAITPTNVNAKPLSNYGSAQIHPVRVGKATLFVQRTGRKLRELFYQFTYNTFQAIDVSLVSEHLTKGGLKQMALQLAPQQIIWIARTDGTKVGVTYDKDQEVCGWHRHTLGGYSDVAQTIPTLMESVACIPAPGIQRDEVWVVANRYINGATARTVEVMTKLWEDGDTVERCVFADASAEYDGVPTTTISGLTWLKGQTVGVLADGAAHPDCVVSSTGTITLQRSASVVQVGLKYTSRAKTLNPESGGADGPSQGKLKRVHRVILRFFQSIGLSLGSDTPGVTAYPEPFRSSADLMDNPVGLFDGDKRWSYDGTWTDDCNVLFETSDMLPSNITLLVAQMDTQDNL